MKRYKFNAKIEASDGGGAYVLFPYDTEEEFATMGKVAVKAIRQQTGKGPGDMIDVEVWKDEASRTVEVPAPFEKLMKKEGLLPFFEGLSHTHRREYCRWIADPKKEETRLKRLEKVVEMLREGVRTPG